MSKIWKSRLLLATIIMTSALIARDLLGVNIHQMILLTVIGLTSIILTYDELFCFTAFIAPIACGVNGFAITILLFFLICKSKNKFVGQFIPALVLIIIELLHFSLYAFPINNALLYFSNILLFFYCSRDSNGVQPQLVVRYFIYGAALCCFLIVGRTYITTGSFMSIFLDSARTTVAMGESELLVGETHMALNANSLAYISILGTTCLLLGRETLGIGKYAYYLLFVIVLFGGTITVGRTWILVLLGVLALYILTSDLKRKLSLVLVLLLGVFLISQTDALNSLLAVMADKFTERFTSSDLIEGGGRKMLWKEYMEIWTSRFDYVIFGIGAPNYRLLFPQINAIHNVIQQALVCSGLLGLLVYVVFFVKVIGQSFRQHIQFINYLPLIAALVYLQSISVLSNWILILPVFPCIYALKIKMK